jgi:hypothetical protein
MNEQWLVSPGLVLAMVLATVPAGADDAERCAEQAEQAPTLRDHGALLDALRLFESCAADACPRVVRQDCRAAIVDLRERIPRLAIRVRDEHGVDLTDAQVTVDGRSVTTEACAQGIPVDPQTHVVRVMRPPFRATERGVVMASTDRTRVLEIVLSAPPAPILTESTSRNRMPAFIVGSVGLASVATFGVLGTWTLVDYEDLRGSCQTSGCSSASVDSAHKRAYIADAFLGTGIATLAVAAVLWLTAPRKGAQ